MHLRKLLLLGLLACTLTACGQKPIHDTSLKENSYVSDLQEAKEAEKGSTQKLIGKYKIEGTENTFYVVEENKLSIVETGTYSFADKGLTIQYGNNSPVTYKVEEVEAGFQLKSGENILLPLEYMEGTDGLMKAKPFSGIYGVVNNGPGYVFYKDGTIEVITTHDATVTNQEISFGGLQYTWKIKNEKVQFYDGETLAITMVPTEK